LAKVGLTRRDIKKLVANNEFAKTPAERKVRHRTQERHTSGGGTWSARRTSHEASPAVGPVVERTTGQG